MLGPQGTKVFLQIHLGEVSGINLIPTSAESSLYVSTEIFGQTLATEHSAATEPAMFDETLSFQAYFEPDWNEEIISRYLRRQTARLELFQAFGNLRESLGTWTAPVQEIMTKSDPSRGKPMREIVACLRQSAGDKLTGPGLQRLRFTATSVRWGGTNTAEPVHGQPMGDQCETATRSVEDDGRAAASKKFLDETRSQEDSRDNGSGRPGMDMSMQSMRTTTSIKSNRMPNQSHVLQVSAPDQTGISASLLLTASSVPFFDPKRQSVHNGLL